MNKEMLRAMALFTDTVNELKKEIFKLSKKIELLNPVKEKDIKEVKEGDLKEDKVTNKTLNKKNK